MSFKLIVATGYFAAALYPSQILSSLPLTGSFSARGTYDTEYACVGAALAFNKDATADMEAMSADLQKALNVPRDAVATRRKANNNMDKLTQKDWDEINAERKKINEAISPVQIKKAFCVDADLWGRN